ncbi:hypothetical protein MNR02_08630 [Shinella sp. H4-D48]|uniref:hypothetical protein n=1 Tax=Shinella sp. H4-D48 TaxID=2925841 RepID=UPI001F531691|nr:hypothetical protein [Shinella sp. H4-D48]UNK36579.1 hypothetical protein MNR02_08630 [Shinella sp. H4-D48]
MSAVFHYVDSQGSYLGAWDANPPANAIAVPTPPNDARQVWDFVGQEWGALPPIISDYEDAIQAHVDDSARSRQFRDGVTLASYTASTNPQWASEAAAFVAWRDAVWAYSYTELAKVQAGQREQPTVDDFLMELPAIIWP